MRRVDGEAVVRVVITYKCIRVELYMCHLYVIRSCLNGLMGHGVEGRATPQAALDSSSAAKVAETLQALASPNRLLILTRLRQSPCTVTDLSAAVGMEQPAVSHQLRLLRTLGLVSGDRTGRNIVYRLYDNHVAQLLDEAIYHIEHLRLGARDDTA
jgi:DNA-binding transcriptional ArsR family regulator